MIDKLINTTEEEFDEWLNSLQAQTSVVAKEALYIVRMAMTELGHAILDLDAKTAGYLIGSLIYQAVESAVFVVVEGLLAAGTVGSAGTASGATVTGAVAFVGARAYSFYKFTEGIKKLPILKHLPTVLKAVDRLG